MATPAIPMRGRRGWPWAGKTSFSYEAVLDGGLWPKALATLADMLETAHIGFCAMDRRGKIYDSIAPRTDPAWDAIYKQYWAFHNPLGR